MHFYLDYYQVQGATDGPSRDGPESTEFDPVWLLGTVVREFPIRSIWHLCRQINFIFVCFNWANNLDSNFEANYPRGEQPWVVMLPSLTSFFLGSLDLDCLAIFDHGWNGQSHSEYSVLSICSTSGIIFNGTDIRLSCCWWLVGFNVSTNQWWNWNTVFKCFCNSYRLLRVSR